MAPSVTDSYGAGVPANAFNNLGIQVLFGLIGAGMVLASIWFFFWAKNGGFKPITKDDWEDYKSTVMRRKGPDGKTLSNATKSTKLGGGSVVHGQAFTEYTDETYKEEKKERNRDLESGVLVADWDRQEREQRRRDPELREYRHEKPARVGGLNRSHDGSHFDYMNSDRSEVTAPPKVREKKLVKKEEQRREKERKEREKQEAKDAAASAKREKERAKAAEKERKEEEKLRAKEEKERDRKSKARGSSRAPPSTITASEVSATTQDSHARLLENRPPRRGGPSAAYSFTEGDDETATVISGTNTHTQTAYSEVYSQPSRATNDSYYANYRPHATVNAVQPEINRHRRDRDQSAHRPSPASRAHSQSPRKQPRGAREQTRPLIPQSEVTSSYTNSDTGTKVYPCYIPGVSKSGPSEPSTLGPLDSASQIGARGYRRGRGRRDSLSDSEVD